MKKHSRLSSQDVDDLLQADRELTSREVKQIGDRIAMEDVVEKAEEAKVTPAWLVRQKKRNVRELLRRLGKLKRGQVYVVRWPKLGWANGYPTSWGKNADQGKVAWQAFLKTNPPKLYHFSGCLPEEAGSGPGMMYEVLKVFTYDLAGVGCAGCGGDLEAKGQDREQARAKARKARKRKPTKPRDLLSLAQVRRQMKEQGDRIKKLR